MRISDWSSDVCSSDLQHLARRPLPQEGGGARRGAIGPGLKDRDQVADPGARQRDLVAETVERRAEAADHRHRLGRLRAEAVRECDGIIAADDRAEIAARGELVVQAAIGAEESLAMALLAVDDTGQIDADRKSVV